MEKTLTKINEWLESEPKDIKNGADLLLTLNRNRILHRSILQRKNIDKLIVEMNRQRVIYQSRVEAMDLPQDSNTKEMSNKELGKKIGQAVSHLKAQEDPAKKKGKREDHDTLSVEVQQLFDRNGDIYPRMRAVHEKLKVLEQPCDRKPYIDELLKLDQELQQNWSTYDNASSADLEEKDVINQKPLTANQVSAARKYLSDNKPKLANLIDAKDEKKTDALRTKMQERLTNLIRDGQEIDEKHLQELLDLGLQKEWKA